MRIFKFFDFIFLINKQREKQIIIIIKMRRRESVKCEPLGFVADLPNQEYFDGQDLMIMLTMMAHGIPQIKREKERERERESQTFCFFLFFFAYKM